MLLVSTILLKVVIAVVVSNNIHTECRQFANNNIELHKICAITYISALIVTSCK